MPFIASSRERSKFLSSEAPPITRRLRSTAARMVVGATVSMVLAGDSLDVTLHYPPELAAILHVPDKDERLILDSLIASDLDKDTKLDCVEKVGKDKYGREQLGHARHWKYFPGIEAIPVIRIKQSQCDFIIQYANAPHKSAVPSEVIGALAVATHEAGHINAPSQSEPEVECTALQTLPDFARALGASDSEAAWTQKPAVDYYNGRPWDYKSFKCHDGGEYDLNPTVANVLPFPKLSRQDG